MRLNTRLICLAAAVVLVGSNWTLDRFCDTYLSVSLARPPVTTPAEQVCWESSSGAMVKVFYLGLLVLAVAAVFGDGESRPPLARMGLRAAGLFGVLIALCMLTLAFVTLHFYGNLNPNFP
jgi:hypothetical protein